MPLYAPAVPRHPGIRNSTGFFPSYYFPNSGDVGSGTNAQTAGRLNFVPVVGMGGLVVNRIGIEVTTFVSSSHARLGIYANNPLTGNPGALIVDAGEVSVAANAIVEADINAALGADLILPDVCWFACNSEGTPTLRAMTVNNTWLTGVSTPNNGAARGIIVAQAYGVMPDPAPAPTAYSNSVPAIFVRKV